MSASVSITDNDVFTALRTFILGLVSCEVVQGLDNGVAMPVDPFIVMTPLYKDRLSTNSHVYADPTPTTGSNGVKQPTQYCIQLDCYGPQSGDWAQIITTMFRDEYGADNLGPLVAPLHADNPKQMPIVDGEQNFEQRWMITAYLQYNPVVTAPIQFFDGVVVNIVDVEATLFNNLDAGFVLDSNSELG